MPRGEKNVEFAYQIKGEQVTVQRCFGEETRVEIPERIEGYPVKRLEDYVFSDAKREPDRKKAVCGSDLLELKLPSSLEEIGRYAFYGCRNLTKMTMHHRIWEIAGGAFTGCHRIRELAFYMEGANGYALKNLVSELRQELRVTLFYEEGRAELLFPEYYEEAVENTPARILETRFHGSGYSYRQCFRDGSFNFLEYDRLFFEAQIWESEDFCIELALLRLHYPWKLYEEAKGCYMSWLMEHRMSAAGWCITFEQNEYLEFLSTFVEWSEGELTELVDQANEMGRITQQSFLMDYRHTHFKKKKKTFEW